MRKHLPLVTIFFLLFASAAVAQVADTYKFVRIPEKYEAFKEEDQYQLNALTTFLFEKLGYTALYKEATPEGVAPCEILKAAVHNDSGIFMSKLILTLEDCNGSIIFKSEEGESRQKDYKAAYHEALRNAFASLEGVELKSADKEAGIVETGVVDREVAERKVAPVLENPLKTTDAKTENLTFSNGAAIFSLKEVASGYHLFQEGREERAASLMKSKSGHNFIFLSKDLQGNAFFDDEENLVVEYVDPNTQLITTVVYKKID